MIIIMIIIIIKRIYLGPYLYTRGLNSGYNRERPLFTPTLCKHVSVVNTFEHAPNRTDPFPCKRKYFSIRSHVNATKIVPERYVPIWIRTFFSGGNGVKILSNKDNRVNQKSTELELIDSFTSLAFAKVFCT